MQQLGPRPFGRRIGDHQIADLDPLAVDELGRSHPHFQAAVVLRQPRLDLAADLLVDAAVEVRYRRDRGHQCSQHQAPLEAEPAELSRALGNDYGPVVSG